MVVDIEIMRHDHDHYVARALLFPEIIIKAASRDEAINQIREALVARQHAGAELVQITLDDDHVAPTQVWPVHAGAFPDDMLYQTMLAEIERQRRDIDAQLES